MQRQFTQARPDQAWVTDITYIRTYEGWLYLAIVLDLYSRAVVGWAMQATMTTELALKALMMAVERRRPKNPVIIHSDQGSQFGSDAFTRWCRAHQLEASMSRRGNCHDNAVAESFFSSLKMSGSNDKSMRHVPRHNLMYSITLKASIIVPGGTVI